MENKNELNLEVVFLGEASEMTLGGGGNYLEIDVDLSVGKGGHN